MKQQSSSIVTLALILAAGGTNFKASAQTADKFPLPTSVAAGTKVQIDGSSSLQAVNQGLKQRFQKQFPNTDVTIPTQYQGSDSGVKAVAQDKADLAGIGRELTKTEKAQGLTTKTIGRSKIAIIVKDNNPYRGNLTLKDFAKIYRGEITDWSQLPSATGIKGKIKVIDRPDSSDTRRAFANYPVFQNGQLKTGSNSLKLAEDSTQSVADKLGADGIGYAPADQIKNIPGIRAITLHGTQPDNPKYPFSQPLAYAYKNKGKVREGAKAFLGYVSNPDGQQAIKDAIAVGATTVAAGTTPGTTASTNPSTPATTTNGTNGATGTTGTTGTTGGDNTNRPTGNPAATTTTNTGKGGFPWWILPLVAIGGGLLWLLGRKKPTETAAPTPLDTVPETAPGIKPLYPPPPARTSRGDGLSGDLSGDLSSIGSGYNPSGDLRSGDLRSGDLSGTVPSPSNINTPNINFNGVVDPIKNKAGDINLAGGAAIAGGAAAAAALGKGIYDTTQDKTRFDDTSATESRNQDIAGDLQSPEVKTPNIDLSNPLEGLKDKSSNLLPDLDSNNPLEGNKDKTNDFIQDGSAAAAGFGGAALAGGAAFAGGVGNLFDDRDLPESSDLSMEASHPDVPTPVEDVPTQSGDLNFDLTGGGITDRIGDFFPEGGAAAATAGGAALAGGAAFTSGTSSAVSDFFSGQPDADRADNLSLDPHQPDRFDLSNPVAPVQDGATDLQDRSGNLIPDEADPFDFSDLDLGNPVLPVQERSADLISDRLDLDIENHPFGDFTDQDTGSILAGGAAGFGGGQQPQTSELAINPEIDTFDRDLESIDLNNLDEDPFAGLSDLLGEETGDINDEHQSLENSGFLDNFKDKAANLLEDGKGFGGAALAGGAAATVGMGQAFQSFFTGKETPTGNHEDISGNLSSNLYSEGQITLVSPNPTQAYTHWEIPVRLKRQLREQGGQKLVVRLYDVTNIDLDIMLPTTFQEFECSDSAWDLELPIDQSEHRYLTEIGYLTEDGGWLLLARSAPLWIPANRG
jgi:phosphate transport system substrate-binding protein